MRSDGVVDMFPAAQFSCHGVDGVGQLVDFVKLVAVGAVAALDVAVEFGGTRREDKELQAAGFAREFEVSLELGTSVDLDGANLERHALEDFAEEALSGDGGGALCAPEHVPATDDVSCGELFEGSSWHWA